MGRHVVLAHDIAAQGTVLLRNEKGLLPFDSGVHSIAVIGDDAGAQVQTTVIHGGFVGSKGLSMTGVLTMVACGI
ncbi:hypothetical protein LH128_20018 [Sphingomonas sp. LH128]|jgi:beta-glucosidase|nr:hypothetical protein LH128_20018 [Sphingomonas sp. LH128]